MKKILAILVFTSLSAFAGSHRPDAHAPIGVMRDHMHKKGEIMLSYRLSYMKMRGLARGDSNSDANSAFASGYMSAPTEMTMKMDMLSAMYGLTDDVTLSAMIGAVKKDMHHQHKMNGRFDRESEGFSDVKISSSYRFFKKKDSAAQFNFGLSLPTGSIDENYSGNRLPYPMQIGSGSYELLPGLSFTSLENGFSYGGQINGVFRLDSNKHGYKLGDSYSSTAWLAKPLGHRISLSTRLKFTKTEAIKGQDATLNPNMIATADASLQERESLDAFLGANYIFTGNFLKGHRLAIEYGMPLYQRFKGLALKDDYRLTVGWQKTF